MKKFAPTFAILFFILPSVSFAAALTSQQSSSLIAVVQSSPGTPASAFVSLITAFSNITVNQATSLIAVVQAAPGVPANAFVNLLTSFTVDTSAAQPPAPPIPTADIVANPTSIPFGGTSTVSWVAKNAVSCTRDSSPVLLAPTGSQTTGVLETSTTYTITCTGTGGSVSGSTTVNVEPWSCPSGYTCPDTGTWPPFCIWPTNNPNDRSCGG